MELIAKMIFYEIQSYSEIHGWTNDASLLGHGLEQSKNLFGTKETAQRVIDSLVEIGFNSLHLRISVA